MKTNYLKISLLALITASAVMMSGCSKDEDGGTGTGGNTGPNVPSTQNSVLFSFTGIWCGPCGLYGKPALNNIAAKHKDRAVIISCQLNGGIPDPFNCAESNSLAGVWGASSIPTVAVGGVENPATKIGGSAQMEAAIDGKVAEINGSAPIANSLITKTIDGGTMKVKVETKFFKVSNGEYYIAAYVLEDKLIERQNVNGQWVNGTEFNNVLRKGIEMGNGTGTLFHNGGIDAGKVFTKEFFVTIDSKWKADNLKVAVVVWKKGPNGFVLVNGNVK